MYNGEKKISWDQINDLLDRVKLASDEMSTEIFRIPRKMSICEKWYQGMLVMTSEMQNISGPHCVFAISSRVLLILMVFKHIKNEHMQWIQDRSFSYTNFKPSEFAQWRSCTNKTNI